MRHKGWGSQAALLILIILLGATLTGCLNGGVVQRAQGGSGPAQDQDLLYVGSREGKVLALDPESRSRGLPFPSPEEWIYPRDKDKLKAIYGTPVVSGGNIYLGTFDGQVHALDAKTGFPRWQQPLEDEGAIIGALAVAGDTVFVAGGDKVYALTADSGQ